MKTSNTIEIKNQYVTKCNFNLITSLTINQLVAENLVKRRAAMCSRSTSLRPYSTHYPPPRPRTLTHPAPPPRAPAGYFCADVTIADTSATRGGNSEPFDRRLKWPREPRVLPRKVTTYYANRILEAGLSNYDIVLLQTFVNRLC